MRLIQLIYVSDLVGENEAAIPAILESSVRRNGENGITGMLLYSHGNFLQVLEGEQDSVRETYSRICKDPRHHNAILLTEEDVSERHFANWSMGYRQLGPEHAAKLPKYAPYFQFGFDVSAIRAKPGIALEMLELFSQGML
ncbi:BLUF domain-containing protein [Candidatus Symbiobacter mobilis]|uniref:BLUF domain protein n=1 Tax=Candidatus Symbiobacter mobilis CR TaxID=946483 RepID=U5NBJ5_9BURK|nr:BLUF domain-containing protein [Candidatus Symbiobacter mobilis]AGX87613.1 BLUF domain protein [Candidatus Symbiobacter mobilis CR]